MNKWRISRVKPSTLLRWKYNRYPKYDFKLSAQIKLLTSVDFIGRRESNEDSRCIKEEYFTKVDAQ